MSKRRALVLGADADVRQRLAACLAAAGGGGDVDVDEAGVAPAEPRHRYVFIAAEVGGAAAVHAIAARLQGSAHVVVVTPRAGLAELTAYLGDPRVNHVLVGDHAETSAALAITARKLFTGDIFGIDKYLPAGAPVEVTRVRDFDGRSRAIEAALEFAEAAKLRRQVRSAIGQVCEELLMNALYDAPVDAQGRSVFADVEPHARVRARSPRPVSLRYAATDSQFVVAVRDRFGRLAKNTVVSYIEKCLSSADQIDRKTYGAGLGLYLVANAAASYVVNVAHGIATEVICTFDRGAKAPLRQVGVFVHPGGAEQLRHGPTPASANREAAGG